MLITIFAKKKTTTEGKKFYTYLTTLTRKDGTTLTTQVKFPEEKPIKTDRCPLNIEVEKTNANLSYKKFTKEDGTTVDVPTLWIKDYTISTTEYVDTSMDDFE